MNKEKKRWRKTRTSYRFGDAAGLEGDEKKHEAGLHDDEELPGGLEVVEGRPNAHPVRHEVQLQAQCYHLGGETIRGGG